MKKHRTHWSEDEELLLDMVVHDGDGATRLVGLVSRLTGRSTEAVKKKIQRDYEDAPDGRRERKNTKPYWQRHTRLWAIRDGSPWEEFEDQMAMSDHSLHFIALSLERTYRAVESRRAVLRKKAENQ